MSLAPIDSFRWVRVDSRPKEHLWLGQSTACQIGKLSRLEMAIPPANPCRRCRYWAEGWLIRHEFGSRFRTGSPSPIGGDTVLPREFPS